RPGPGLPRTRRVTCRRPLSGAFRRSPRRARPSGIPARAPHTMSGENRGARVLKSHLYGAISNAGGILRNAPPGEPRVTHAGEVGNAVAEAPNRFSGWLCGQVRVPECKCISSAELNALVSLPPGVESVRSPSPGIRSSRPSNEKARDRSEDQKISG